MATTAAPTYNPSTESGLLSSQAGQNQNFWEGALNNGNFNAPNLQTPDAGAAFQPAQQGNAGFLQTQAQALGGLVGNQTPGANINAPQVTQNAGNAWDLAQNKSQNSGNLSGTMKNAGIADANTNTNYGINTDITNTNNAFDTTQQTAVLNAMMQEYQLEQQEAAQQAKQGDMASSALAGFAGKFIGQQAGAAINGGGSQSDSFVPGWQQPQTLDQNFAATNGPGVGLDNNFQLPAWQPSF